ncbi:MAG TPA: TonB-dependent receptor [Allosphingosinicella sp.]|nr:TonB-dependent receptor [Allosphingosinicella sp.]
MKKIALLCATTAFVMPSMAMAQSSGSVDFEEESTVVVTGTRTTEVGGVEVPPTTRARAALDSEFIQRQAPGQTVNDVINSLPGVSFQNNDPYGSAGGTLTIRGFDSTRISQTFDGVPLNDSGNYALYSNQQLDPELITQVNVSLGSTDIDSPTAAATGSTVNYRTRLPTEDFHVRLQGSIGEYDFFRVFGVVDTGAFGPWGTRAFFAASMAQNDVVFNDYGQVYKQQYNARIYQPIGSNGDFISIAGHYNQNRNNFLGSVPLRTDGNWLTSPGTTPRRSPLTDDERFYSIARCTTNQVVRPGLADTANTCGSQFDERWNPSNTGNIRIQSRFTLADGLVLNIEPSYQYVKANGGGTVVAQEARRDVNAAGGNANCNTTPNGAQVSCQSGYIGGTPYFGRDVNGDGDLLDTIRVAAPSQTQTDRYGVIAGLRWDINDQHTVRLAYSYDRASHRQTGEISIVAINGSGDYFPVNNPLMDVTGAILQKRDRQSYAILNQIAGEYRGEFFEGRLVVNAGLRAPFFTRDLTNNCATSSVTGFVECFDTNTAGLAAYLAANPTQTVSAAAAAAAGATCTTVAPIVCTFPTQGAQQRTLKYDKLLPNFGFTYEVASRVNIFANYSRGLQVPGTDNLYNSFYFPVGSPNATPRPETTDNFDIGLRYRSGRIQAQGSFWYTRFQDRLASSFDPELERSVYRNLGTVDKYGFDGMVSFQVLPQLQFYVFGSYLWSDIKDNVQVGNCTATVSASCPAGSTGQAIFAQTAGMREGGAPIYTFGARVQGTLGPIEIGLQFKRTGSRYVNDINQPIAQCFTVLPTPGTNGTTTGFVNTVDCPTGSTKVDVFPARTGAYNIVDLDIRVPLGWAGLNDQTFFQLNVSNLFDERYIGGFTSNLLDTTVPFAQIGAPRAIMGTLVVGF